LRILVVTATDLEVAPFAAELRAHPRHDVEILVTGVGMVATAAGCARALAQTRYDVALNLGLCGTFDPGLPPGTVVHVVHDRLCELGAEDGDGFLPIDELELLKADPPALNGYAMTNAKPPISGALMMIPGVNGVTVNKVHGNNASIAFVRERFAPQVESMEGAAFMFACLLSNVPFAQVRAVSNIVERRNRSAWRIDDALRSLGASAVRILETLPAEPSKLTDP
jgi:futalosine hydrolase